MPGVTAAVEVDFDLFSLNVFKKKTFGGMMNFVQSYFLLHCSKTYCKSIRYEGKQLFLWIIEPNLIFHNVYGSACDVSNERGQVIPSLIRKAIKYPKEDFVVGGKCNAG